MHALLMSVGAGKGVENAIAQSVNQHNPSAAAFLVTERSCQTLAEASKTLREIHSNEQAAELLEAADSEGLCVRVSDSEAEDITACYRAAVRALELLADRGASASAVTVDFTGGTKAMSGGLVLAAVYAGCKSLSYVGGSVRDEAGRVVRGAEAIASRAPLQIHIDLITGHIIESFNHLRFGTCRAEADWVESKMDLSLAPHIRAVRVLADFYEAWDRFDHTAAVERVKDVKDAEREWEIDTQCNRSVVHVLADARQEPLHNLLAGDKAGYLMADIYANAHRRMSEGRFDDAAARLYRVTELAAQVALQRDFGQSTSSVDRDFLAARGLLESYANSVNRKNDIQLGLYNAYRLLKDLGSPVGGVYLDNESFQKHINVRNESILAHGIAPVDRAACEKLSKDARNACASVMSEERFDSLVSSCRFPTLSRPSH